MAGSHNSGIGRQTGPQQQAVSSNQSPEASLERNSTRGENTAGSVQVKPCYDFPVRRYECLLVLIGINGNHINSKLKGCMRENGCLQMNK